MTYPIAAGRELNAVAILPDKLKPVDGYADWAPELREILQISEWMAWPLLAVPQMESWLNGRIGLIGDAAHAMLPFAAQGGASAIEDAVTIAEYIAAGRDLKLWEMRRKPRVDKIAATARNNRTIYHLAGVAAVARNMVMKRVGPERLLARLDWIFGYDTASAG
ncbi:MAG: FAD-dependent monooxygenase [Pseudomonadota bacterium]